MDTETELNRIVDLVCKIGKLPTLNPDDDYYDQGFSSINALQLLMELEEQFAVSIGDDDFVAARTCSSLLKLVSRLEKDNR
jgi:acyl carrier protein